MEAMIKMNYSNLPSRPWKNDRGMTLIYKKTDYNLNKGSTNKFPYELFCGILIFQSNVETGHIYFKKGTYFLQIRHICVNIVDRNHFRPPCIFNRNKFDIFIYVDV